jgi:DNA-binding NarL/FixJ family response regulator
MIRVMVADDHALVRTGLATLLDREDDMEIVAEAGNGQQAVEQAGRCQPDVILMDLSMPIIDGIEATRRILASNAKVQVLVLSSFSDRARVHDALAAGAIGYLLKDCEPADVLAGIRAAARCESPLDPRIARTLLTGPIHPEQPLSGPGRDRVPMEPAHPEPAWPEPSRPEPAATLSRREREVLSLVAKGLANKQIGRMLGITEHTVKVHLGNAFRRIGVNDRTSAALWASKHLAEAQQP